MALLCALRVVVKGLVDGVREDGLAVELRGGLAGEGRVVAEEGAHFLAEFIYFSLEFFLSNGSVVSVLKFLLEVLECSNDHSASVFLLSHVDLV